MIRASRHRRAALAGAVMLSVFACRAADLAAPHRVLTPESASSQRNERGRRAMRQQPALVGCDVRATETSRALIGPRGGILRFGGSRLVVPAGALHETVRITATTRGDASSAVDFQPEGLRFRTPARLMLTVVGCDTPARGDPSIVYVGADGAILETITATFNRGRSQVVASIVHFSGYAIAF
jgi:hypothetical protein